MESILNSIKHVLGQDAAYTEFDTDIIMHANSVFSILNQLGIGPDNGFAIEDASSVWFDFIGNVPMLNSVKTYIYLRVRMLFDPPATSFHLSSMEKQIAELEFRLNVYRESMLHPIGGVVV